MILLAALSLLAPCVAAAPAQGLSYMTPGTEAVGGMEDMVLIYHGHERRVEWTAENLSPYVAWLNEDGQPVDWLFDSFLFIEFSTDDGTWLHHYREQTRLPTISDWIWMADGWFRPNDGIAGLEGAVARAADELGAPPAKRRVVIGMPLPLAEDHAFGPIPGEAETLDLARPEDAQRALAWYIDRVCEQWEAAEFEHLELVGFYWTAEGINAQYGPLARWTSDHLHDLDLKHVWIPYYGAAGYTSWQHFGFDAVMLQPNYFFTSEDRSVDWFRGHATRVQVAHTGVEVEFDTRALTDERFRRRFYDYLDAGVAYGWMKGALLGYYEGGRAVLDFYGGGAEGRKLYDDLYRFVRGMYEPTGETDFPPLEVVDRDPTGDLALASKGAKVHDAADLPEWRPGITPEKMIDGDIYNYGGMYGFTAFYIPGSVTVELPDESPVARTHVKLFDLDHRFFRYRIDTSLDGENWESAVDKTEGEWRGWQVDCFEARRAKFVRFTCTHNSVNPICQVVELEVYED